MKKLLLIGVIPILLFLLTPLTFAADPAPASQAYNGKYDPALSYQENAIKDCNLTATKIAGRSGASWNSEHGWMYEDQCERLRIDDEYNYRHTTTEGLQRRGIVSASVVTRPASPS